MLSTAAPSSSRLLCPRCQQVRHATLIRRPKRPYTFTQLVTLSDGSTFLHRTTSPQPVYRSTKDSKNSMLWNPSSQRLLNIEEDEAGRLRRFRQRFGRGFDVDSDQGDENAQDPTDGEVVEGKQDDQSLLDLISTFGKEKEGATGDETPGGGVREEKQRSGKGKGGEK